MLNYLAVFAATIVSDWVWAEYIQSTSQKQPLKASLYSGAVVLIGAYVTMSYLKDPISLIFAVAGGMLGTYLSVRK